MAVRINLLPWREERRKQRERNFYTALGVAAALGVGVGLLGYFYLQGRIDYQQERNDYLHTEIAKLDRKIVRIRELEETRQRLKARMRVIETLQKGRPQVVHLMNQFVSTLPDGLYLSKLREGNNAIVIEGVAESNARVSNYMENLAGSDWLHGPDLSVIEVSERNGRRLSSFTLSVGENSSDSKNATNRAGEDG